MQTKNPENYLKNYCVNIPKLSIKLIINLTPLNPILYTKTDGTTSYKTTQDNKNKTIYINYLL